MFQEILMDFSWAGLLLLVGYFLRSKVKVFQNLFIPVAVIAGLVGLLLGSEVLGKVSPVYLQWSENVSSYANPLLAILFVSQFLTLKLDVSRLRKCTQVFAISAIVIAAQFVLVVPITRLFSLPDGFALLPSAAFYGAHGVSAMPAGVFSELGYWNYDEAVSVGNTFATIGMLFGIIGGIILINVAMRKHWLVSKEKGQLSEEELTGYVQKENRKKFMSEISSVNAVNPFAVHCAIIGCVMVLAYLLLPQIQKIPVLSGLAIQIPAIIIALIVDVIASKTSLGDVLDGDSLRTIGGTALEFLIIISVATTNLGVVIQYALPIIIIAVIALVATTLLVLLLSKVWLKENWFENGMVMFGAWTGSTATGIMLQRVADPEMKTDAGTNYIMQTPFSQLTTQTFYLMFAPYMVVTAAGCNNLLMISIALIVVMLLVGFVLARKN